MTKIPNIFFTVVIPTYNRANFIGISIKSVLAQNYTHFELIIVDDGSTDDTENVVKSFTDNRIKYFKIKNSERAVARNTGIRAAKGGYITFLDSDDIYYSNYLQNASESIEKFKSPPFFHLGYEVKDKFEKQTIHVKPIKDKNIYCLLKPNPLSCMGIFIRKDVAQKNQFNDDRNLSGTEDWELWIRIVAKYGIRTDNRISSAIIDHENRSMMDINPLKLIRRVKLSLIYSFKNENVKKTYGNYKKTIIANSYCYIALHLALGKHKNLALKYLLKSIILKPFIIFDKRSLATIKRLLW